MKFVRQVILVGLCALSIPSFSQSPDQPYFIVIGAFRKLDNAIRYTSEANQANFSAQYGIQPQRDLYYVYILNTADRRKAFAFLIKIRAETKYKDAWFYEGKLGEEQPPAVAEPEPVVVPPVVIEEPPKKDSVVVEEVKPVIDSTTLVKPVEEKKPAGKPFLFKLTNEQSGNEVMGEVHVQESAKASQYQAFKGNEVVYLQPPRNAGGTYQVSIQAPGYKPVKVNINYDDPSASSSGKGEQQEFIIPFELKSAKKGDYIDFNNVRFFRNSAILEAESQSELDGLVALMNENKKYKIKIHGHSNGNGSRDIITMGTSQNYFALDAAANKRESATAKKLTEYRAEVVRDYLVSQGIDASRITTKGEGGKMMIYPGTSTLANYNDRVEIEVKK